MISLICKLLSMVAFLLALTVHEYCHALAGYLMGDETAKRMGRLTLNPLAHIDPVGTVLLPLIGAFTGFPVIGWAKPVPFNPYNLRNQKWGATVIGLVGPLSNFLFALLSVGLLKLAVDVLGFAPGNLAVIFLANLAIVNIWLGIFNFIPVPPLDGSKVLTALLDAPKYRRFLDFLETRGSMIIFIIIILEFSSPTGGPISFVFNTIAGALFSVSGLLGVLGRVFGACYG